MTAFLQQQQQKLDELIKRIPASQRSIYNQRIRQLQSSIKEKKNRFVILSRSGRSRRPYRVKIKLSINTLILEGPTCIQTSTNSLNPILTQSRKGLVTKRYLLAPVPYSRELVKPIQRPISRLTV
jgi:hypothetical protein